MASGLGHQNNVLGLAVCPDGQGVVIVGQRFVRFLRVEGRALKSSAGVLGKLGVVQVHAILEGIFEKIKWRSGPILGRQK